MKQTISVPSRFANGDEGPVELTMRPDASVQFSLPGIGRLILDPEDVRTMTLWLIYATRISKLMKKRLESIGAGPIPFSIREALEALEDETKEGP